MSIRQDKLKGNNTQKFIITIVDSVSKEPIDEIKWNDTNLEIKEAHGVSFDWTADGMDCPNMEITPFATDKYSAIDVGNWKFTITTVSKTDPSNRLSTEFDFEVLPFTPFSVENKNEQLSQRELKEKSHSITVQLLDPHNFDQDGEWQPVPVSGDRWAHVTNLEVTDGNGVTWDCKRSSTEGEYILTPYSADGRLRSVAPGTYEFTVTGTYDDGDLENWTASAVISLTVTEEPARQLDLDVTIPPDAFPQSRYHMKDADPIIVTASSNGAVIDDRLWNLVDETTDIIVVPDDPDGKLDFEIKKGIKTGTWEIHPLPYKNKGYWTSHDRVRFTVRVNIVDGEEAYEGKKTEDLNVREEFWWCTWEWVCDNLWWLIPTLLAIFYLLAYVFPKKKHLRTGKYELQFVYAGANRNFSKTVPIKKVTWTVLMPFKPVRARLKCNAPSYTCDFPNVVIESVGHGQFRIRSESLRPNMNLAPFSINNFTYQNVSQLLQATFSLSGFAIVTSRGLTKQGTVRVREKRGHRR